MNNIYSYSIDQINSKFQYSKQTRLVVNASIALISGLFLIAIGYVIYKYGIGIINHRIKINMYLYVAVLALLLIFDSIATANELREIRKNKTVSLANIIPIAMLIVTVALLGHQLYRWKFLHKKKAKINLLFSSLKIILLFGIMLQSGLVVHQILREEKQE